MAKVWVIDKGDTRMPFLRGILTRSLMEAGLSFDVAYKASSVLRQHLDAVEEIDRDKLRKRVARYLEAKHGPHIRAAYELRGKTALAVVQIRNANGEVTPFSRLQLLRALESCGCDEEQAIGVTRRVVDHLEHYSSQEIAAQELHRFIYDRLHEQLGAEMAHRYLVWVDNTYGGRPLVLLIGGATGTGKSTIATEVAHRLGIVRTQSTDMLREVMRMMIPKRLLPVLHTSSFNAGLILPGTANNVEDLDTQLADGYLTQSNLLAVPCEAVIQRALREQVSVILEGVHIHPFLLQKIKLDKGATLVMVMLAVLDPKQLRGRLARRLHVAPERSASGYLNQFERIWRLQSFLLSEADRAGVPILINEDKEKIVNLIIATILDELARNFNKSPREVFACS